MVEAGERAMEDLSSESHHCTGARAPISRTSGPACRELRCGRAQTRAIGHRTTGRDVHVESDRLEAGGSDLDAVRTRFQIHLLERTVEVVDDSDEVAVD